MTGVTSIALSLGQAVIAIIVWVLLAASFYSLGTPIDHLSQALHPVAAPLAAVASVLAAAVAIARDWFTHVIHLRPDSPYYRWVDSFLLFDLAIVLWLFVFPLVERRKGE